MSLLDTASLIVTPNGYKEGKLYSVIPSDGSGDLSVTRATTATRVNSAGLVELVPYNLLSYSEAFDNAAWTKSSITISANSTTAPDGQTTADTLTNSSSSGIILQTYSSVNTSQIVTHSVYLKRTNNDWAVLAIARSGATTYGEMYVWFNLSTGVVGGNLPDGAAVILDTEIENVGNGWYRCSVTGYVPNAVAYTAFMLYPDGNNSFTRVTGQSVYAWGAQLVEGSTAKDYQKTETRLNIPRLDYSNGTCPSLLVEPQRTNLLTYSSSFDNAAWLKYSGGTGSLPAITANSTNSPSGVQDADTIVLNAGSGTSTSDQSLLYQNFSVTNGTTYTFSFYAKGAVGGEQIMARQAGGGSYTKFTLTTEWERYTLTESASYTGNASVDLTIRRGLTEPINASATFYLWGAQIEVGSYSTSYIPTTSASVTRNADVISKTGISSLIGQTEGTVFVDCSAADLNTFKRIAISSGSYLSSVYLDFRNDGSVVAAAWTNAGLAFYYTITPSNPLNRNKYAIGYKANDWVVYVNGSLAASQSSGGTTFSSTLSTFELSLGGNDNFFGDVNAAALWKTRLTNTQLAQLTTI